MAISVGDAAPNFTLPGIERAGTDDEARRDYSLEEFRGGPVVLVFYPGDNTVVCTRQLNAYSGDIEEFEGIGAQVVAISPQSVESHAAFSSKQGTFAFPLLADVDKAVGGSYGVVGFGGLYRRSVFVVDGDGAVSYAHRTLVGATYRPTSQLLEAIRAAKS